jgi:ribosomal protein S18 acetylase RimI-like enzyme
MSGSSPIISGSAVSVSIRMADMHDLSWVGRIAPEVFDNPVNPQTLLAYFATPLHFLLIAEAGGHVVGQLSAVIHRHPDSRPTELYIDEIGVSPAYQRKGIATQLIEMAFAEGRKLGCVEAWLGTETDNSPALALYKTRAVSKDDVTMFVFDLDQT